MLNASIRFEVEEERQLPTARNDMVLCEWVDVRIIL